MSSVFITIRDLIQPIELRDVLQICQDNVRTILIAGVSVGVWWLATRKPRGIPPGPRFTLPIVGDLLFLSKKGDNGDIRLPMRRFRKKYGNIFSLYLGTRLVIVVNGYKLLKEVFIKEGEIFSDRPSTFINDHIGQRKGVIGTSGNHWKEQRKFTLETLREFGFGRTILEDKIHEEIEVLVDDIQKHGGKKIDMFRTVQKAISNVISSIIFGKRFEYDDPTFIGFLERLEENFKYLGGTSLFNFIPSLRFLPGDLFNVKKVIKNVRFVESNIFKPAVEEHINNYNEDNTNDFISSYIKEIKKMEKTGQETTIDRDNLEKVIGDLFVAGTETTSTTILWIILYFLHYPKVYEKCYKEIQEVIGSGRLPSMKDKPSMPYNEAVILEVLRVVDIATIGVPHTVSHDTTFQGFTIPKNTIILPNIDIIPFSIGIIMSSGQPWKEQRKFALETLREFGFGRTILEDKIQEEIEVLVGAIQQHGGKSFDMCRLIQSAVSNIICNLVFGKRFEYTDKQFLHFLDKAEENIQAVGTAAVINFLPFLRFLPGDIFKFKRTVRNIKSVEDILVTPSIEEHIKNYDENNTDDYISSYIKEMKKEETQGETSSIDKENLVKSIGDLFIAGTETTSTTILWAILYFLHYPKVYEKCYKEIQDVIGSGRLPSMKDKPSMPYNEAVSLEILRVANIVHIGVPHAPSRDVIYQGYRIPKDAIIIPNIDSVLASDEVWGDADTFRPERFLDSNGQIIRREEWIPFSIGRRMCLGEALAKMEIFLFLTTLIQRFDFKAVDDENLPSLNGTFGITHAPVKYEVKVIPR